MRAAGAEGGRARFSRTGAGADSVTFPLAITQSGTHEVFARWPVYLAGQSTATPYVIHHDGGTTTVTVDQSTNGGQWNSLGLFDFTQGGDHKIVVTDGGPGQWVVADAVRVTTGPLTQPTLVADAARFEWDEPSPPVSSRPTREYVTLAGLPLALIEGGALRHVHADHLGSPQKMTDATGSIVWDAQFRPFGEAHSIAGAAANPQRFPGQYADAATGLHYNYFRDYDPSVGRYIQSDPIGLAGGLDTYSYVNGNPVYAIDPTGELVFCLTPHGQVICGAVAGASAVAVYQLITGCFDWKQILEGAFVGGTLFWGGGRLWKFGPAFWRIALSRGKSNNPRNGNDPKPNNQGEPVPSGGGGSNPPHSPDFVVSPGGTVYPVPRGASGPSPVVNSSGDVTGSAFTGGSGGGNGQVSTIRIMNPTAPRGSSPGYPNGYVRYQNSHHPKPQGVDPYSGQTRPNSETHFPID